MTVDEYFLLDPRVLTDPYPYYEALRTEAPVYLSQLGVWLVSSYDDVMSVVRDPDRFSSHMPLASIGGDPSPELSALRAEAAPPVDTLLTNDPPSHTRYRALVNKAFSPRRVAQMEPGIRRIANDLIDRFVTDGRVELVSQFAVGVPLTVIADALGVDRADMAAFKRWSDDSVAPLSGLLTEERKLECARTKVELQNYMRDRIAERRVAARDDLLSDLVQARLDDGEGDALNEAELLSVIEQLLVAGNETTTKLITAGMLLLVQNSEQLDRARARPELIPNLVEEALRYEAPVQMLFRVAKQDVELHGVCIPAGASLMVMYGSANRDEAKFDRADEFDIERPNARVHLSFGQGPHFCVGAALARTEGRIAFESLLERLEDIAVAEDNPYERELSMILRGWKSLHLTFKERAR